jgi:hypothetical protein
MTLSLRTNRKLNAQKTMMRKMIATFAAFTLVAVTSVWAGGTHTSTQFMGAKANKGTVTHTIQSSKNILTLSDDFVIPDTPAPHWQVVDSHGHTYLLQRLKIKGDKFNKTIALPDYIQDVAKVQIWCAWAEVLLGEASFHKPVELTSR